MDEYEIKAALLGREARLRDVRRREHALRELMFEMTDACNLRCLHCGSSCEASGDYLDVDAACALLDEVAGAYDPGGIRVTATGGEPFLNGRLFDMLDHAHGLGFQLGMTTNGMLITPERARHLADLEYGSVTVSLDGMEGTHDAFRGVPGAWRGAVRGMGNLIDAGITPSVTTVANATNIGELDGMGRFLDGMGVRLWRIVNIDPIGRALRHPELLLDDDGMARMFAFIEETRTNHPENRPDVIYSCAHYLGIEHELETRPWVFSCRSGVDVASVTAKGEYVGCLDVPRIPALTMGRLGEDSFVDRWENGYGPYRTSRARLCGMCRDCEHAEWCDGDAMHTWDFERNEPLLCIGS